MQHEMIQENAFDEKYKMSADSMRRIKSASDDYARKVFGDKYGTRNDILSDLYFPDKDINIKNDANLACGLFSLGNNKLDSPSFLIINFTSALGCPSINSCPITQKGCYAVAMENRLNDTRKKNLIVQNLVRHAKIRNMLDGLFDIAELYIIESRTGKNTPIRYIRYNEAGDFTDQNLLIKAARFSRKMRDEYGVISMAYTANPRVHPEEEVDGEPIDTIISINRSRNDIGHSENSVDKTFFGIKMQNFSTNPEVNLDNAYSDVDEVEDKDLQKLKVEQPILDRFGIPSIPVLNKGSWDGGSGYYYICPCSFWKYNKDKATRMYLENIGLVTPEEDIPSTPQGLSHFLNKKGIKPNQKKELKKILDKIISPCGRKCGVCHDLTGGVTKDGQRNIKNYSILTALHGATRSNYNPEYAAAKRRGDDSVKYSEDSLYGQETKYIERYRGTDSPIRHELFKRSADNSEKVQQKKDEFKNEMKRFFGNII